jgi:hypothetical protein
LFIKTNKNIFIKYESNNNYLIYLPKKNKIINTKDCLIKKDLIYLDNYNLINNNYINLKRLEIIYKSNNIYENIKLRRNNNINNNNNNNNNNNFNLLISDVSIYNSFNNNESSNKNTDIYNISPNLENNLNKLNLDYNKSFKK